MLFFPPGFLVHGTYLGSASKDFYLYTCTLSIKRGTQMGMLCSGKLMTVGINYKTGFMDAITFNNSSGFYLTMSNNLQQRLKPVIISEQNQ